MDEPRSDAFFLRIDDNCLVRNRAQQDSAWVIFAVASSLMVAHQVAGKALRDGLFLSRFAPSDLPKIVAAAAVVSVLLGLGFARLLANSGPFRVVPLAFGSGALLHLAEFMALRNASDDVRSVVIPFVYLHLVGYGAILLSGFWSVANEYFDPREAKLRFGRIAGAGTAGGVAGGLMAERTAALYGVDAVLAVLTVLHFAVALTLWRVPPDRTSAPVERETGAVWQHQPAVQDWDADVHLVRRQDQHVLEHVHRAGAAGGRRHLFAWQRCQLQPDQERGLPVHQRGSPESVPMRHADMHQRQAQCVRHDLRGESDVQQRRAVRVQLGVDFVQW
ncbi:MAG: hypothetical protein ABI806_23495 [Candidatus Solibacter sp.]